MLIFHGTFFQNQKRKKKTNVKSDSLDRIKKAADKFKKKNPLEGLDVKISTQNTNIDSVKKLVKEKGLRPYSYLSLIVGKRMTSLT